MASPMTIPYVTANSTSNGSTKRSMPPHVAESPAKKQSKWSAEEDALIIELRGGAMKWEDISKRLPGRSAISCRLHYQNYLERRSEWDEERKNKLARLYERFKPEMWSKIAEEMQLPWRAAEAMHWQLGEADMARRAGVVPFSLSAVSIDAPPQHPPGSSRQLTPGPIRHTPRGHSHSHSLGSMNGLGHPSRYSRSHTQPSHLQPLHNDNGLTSARAMANRRESTPRSMAQQNAATSPTENFTLAGISNSSNSTSGYTGARGVQLLPSVAEMTTGVTMASYSAPTFAVSTAGLSTSTDQNVNASGRASYQQPVLAPSFQPVQYSMDPRRVDSSAEFEWQQEGKRRLVPEMSQQQIREISRRRQ